MNLGYFFTHTVVLVYSAPNNTRQPEGVGLHLDFNSAAGVASILGLIVGAGGLLFSVMAWRRAAAAERAATEAREAVRRGDAAEDLGLLAELAGELLASVQNEQVQAAVVRGRDLVSGIAHASVRWRAYFPSPEIEGHLEEIARDVEKISKALTKKGDLTPTERDRLLNFCHKALRILSTEAGRMAGHVDSSASGR